MSKSNRRMTLLLFEEDYQYFPSLKEIRDGLISALMRYIDHKANECGNKRKSMLIWVKKSYKEKWKFFFSLANLGDLNKPLTPKILSNPYHKITKHLLYIYSMESFIYQDLNRACRDQDVT